MEGEKKPPLSPLAQAQAALAEANRKLLTDDQLHQALGTFEQIMAYRNDMYLRLSRRVRTAVRGGMAVFALVGMAMFILLVTLAMQVEHARNSTALLARHVNTVAEDMQLIEATMVEMEKRMQLFGSIGEYMHVMTDQTGVIAGGMADLDRKMSVIENQMTSINGRLLHVTGGMGSMGHAVNGMGYSINEIARPAGMFGMTP
jgi:hypothetical protein